MQVIKTRIKAFEPSAKRMQLTLAIKKSQPAGGDSATQPFRQLMPGELREGVVSSIQRDEHSGVAAYGVDLLEEERIVGTARLEAAHVCDHPGAVEALEESLQAGSRIPPFTKP